MRLKKYFEKRVDVLLAFVFGLLSQKRERATSDWNIAVYLTPERYGELEVAREFVSAQEIANDLNSLLKRDVDLPILNRAKSSLVFSILNSGEQLAVKDRKLYLNLLSKTHYEAVDYWNFVYDFQKIYERSSSKKIKDVIGN